MLRPTPRRHCVSYARVLLNPCKETLDLQPVNIFLPPFPSLASFSLSHPLTSPNTLYMSGSSPETPDGRRTPTPGDPDGDLCPTPHPSRDYAQEHAAAREQAAGSEGLFIDIPGGGNHAALERGKEKHPQKKKKQRERELRALG